MFRIRLVLLGVLMAPFVLSGCHLLDQTDFRPRAAVSMVPPQPPVPDPETRVALVTIDYQKADPEYRAPLAAVIRTVESRRPGVLYDVVAEIGSAAEAPAARTRAAEVMTAIETEAVIPARIQLGLRVVAGLKTPRVRVYLR